MPETVVDEVLRTIGGDSGQDEGPEVADEPLPDGDEDQPGVGDEQGEDGEEDSAEQEEPGDDEAGDEPEDKDSKGEDPEAEEPGEAQDSVVDQAVNNLQKVLGKELSDKEAVEELSKSYLSAGVKIEDQAGQIRNLVEVAKNNEAKALEYDRLVSHPQIRAVLEGRTLGQQAQDLGLEEDIPAGALRLIQGLQQKVTELERGQATEKNTQLRQELERATNEINQFAGEAGNEDFKTAWGAWQETRRVNPYATMPEKLKKWAILVDQGVNKHEAWGALNPDKLRRRIETNISKKNDPKLKRKVIKGGSAPKANKDYDNAESISDLMDAVVQNVNSRS